MAAAFANIFMAKIEMQILDNCAPLEMLLDDIISLLHTNWYVVNQFIEQVIKHHPTITFMAEISVSEVTFLDTAIYKGERFNRESVLDMRTHFKPTGTFHVPIDNKDGSKTRVIHREQRKASLKAKRYDPQGLLLQKKFLLDSSKDTWLRKATRKNVSTTHSQKWNLKDVNGPLSNTEKRTVESCPL